MSNRLVAGAMIGAASLCLAGLASGSAAPRPPPPRPVASHFVHPRSFDVFGYYIPSFKAQAGAYQLDNLSMGSAAEFAAWERGERSATYAPVMLVFSDTRSPMATNELGQEHHTVEIRVLPDSYRVVPGQIEFRGHDRRLGLVILSGGIDARALAKAKHQNMPETVVRGGLALGGERTRNISFTYFAGD